MFNRITPFVLIVLAIALFWLYTLPTFNTKIASANMQIKDYNNALQAADTFSQKENQLLAQRNAIPSSSISRLETYLPDSVDNVQLILDVNQLASRSGVVLSDFTIASGTSSTATGNTGSAGMPIQNAVSTGAGLTNTLTLSVDASGTYDSFRAFLAGVEQSLRPLDITSLSLQSSLNGIYKYKIIFQIYWLR